MLSSHSSLLLPLVLHLLHVFFSLLRLYYDDHDRLLDTRILIFRSTTKWVIYWGSRKVFFFVSRCDVRPKNLNLITHEDCFNNLKEYLNTLLFPNPGAWLPPQKNILKTLQKITQMIENKTLAISNYLSQIIYLQFVTTAYNVFIFYRVPFGIFSGVFQKWGFRLFFNLQLLIFLNL